MITSPVAEEPNQKLSAVFPANNECPVKAQRQLVKTSSRWEKVEPDLPSYNLRWQGDFHLVAVVEAVPRLADQVVEPLNHLAAAVPAADSIGSTPYNSDIRHMQRTDPDRHSIAHTARYSR